MEDAQRWSVTYTNHVKQKRKVYQDGFLGLQSSRHKVMLYDEWDKLLETRFVKKDDVIKCGETLTFDSYLVDIGEPCGGNQPTSVLNCQEKDRKISEKSGSSYRYNFQKKKPMFGKSKGQVTSLSPSQKLIRDFKKGEMNKSASSPSCMDMAKLRTREWQVLYTTQITQKAKKFHDGFLQLIVRGLQGRQIKLYDTNRRHLDSRFLKKDEIVCSGESLAFEGHLVEIGEQEGDHKPPTDLTLQGKNGKVVGKTDLADHQVKIPTNKKFPAGKAPDDTSGGKFTNLNDSNSKIANAKLSGRDAKPKRAVHDILSILRQPIERKFVPMNEPLAEDCLELHPSDVQPNTKSHIKEHAEECSGTAREELREKTSDNDSRIKVLTPGAVEVIIDSVKCRVSENGRESQARPPSFCLRSETTNCMAPILDVEYTDHNKLISSSSVESDILASPALSCERQMLVESATLTRSNENEESENPPEICSCEEIVTETNGAPSNGLSSRKLSKLWQDGNGSKAASCVSAVASNDCTSHDLSGVEETTHMQDFNTKKMDEFPSFDLGF